MVPTSKFLLFKRNSGTLRLLSSFSQNYPESCYEFILALDPRQSQNLLYLCQVILTIHSNKLSLSAGDAKARSSLLILYFSEITCKVTYHFIGFLLVVHVC